MSKKIYEEDSVFRGTDCVYSEETRGRDENNRSLP